MNLKEFLKYMTVGTSAKILINGEQQMLTYDFYVNKADKYKVIYYTIVDNTLHIEVTKIC